MSLRKPQTAERPWYCIDPLVDDYLQFATTTGGDLVLLKYIKAIQLLIANVLVGALGLYAVSQGGTPTILGTAAIITLGLLNGALALDYTAVAQAIVELSEQSVTVSDQDDTDD